MYIVYKKSEVRMQMIVGLSFYEIFLIKYVKLLDNSTEISDHSDQY